MYDLFCLGGSSLDLILQVPRLPHHDEKLVARFTGRSAGGLIANAACAAAQLGCRTGWSGALGDDDFGRVALEDFHQYGVDCSLVEVQPQSISDFCIILLDPSGERTILVVPTLKNSRPLTAPILRALESSRIGYSMPHAPDWFHAFSGAIHRGGGMVAIDLEASSPASGEALQEALRQTDLVFCSLDGLELATGTREASEGAPLLMEQGVSMVVITQGRGGAVVMTPQERVQAPGYTVPVVDTTGAGDCFHAAFITALLEHWSLESALKFANAAAAIKVQHAGPRGGLPTRKQVEDFIKQWTT